MLWKEDEINLELRSYGYDGKIIGIYKTQSAAEGYGKM